jgi:hypothetical protein
MQGLIKKKTAIWLIAGSLVLGIAPLTGCQVTQNGQTFPSAYYMDDDIYYAPAGLEFQHSREAAAIRDANAEMMMQQ